MIREEEKIGCNIFIANIFTSFISVVRHTLGSAKRRPAQKSSNYMVLLYYNYGSSDFFLSRQLGQLVGLGDREGVLGQDQVHHLAVWKLHGRARQHESERDQHPRREYR